MLISRKLFATAECFFIFPPIFDKFCNFSVLQYLREVIPMQTFYIDIYFLITFTVDILALYVAVRVLRVGCRIWRLVLSALLGALVAVVDAFLYSMPVFRAIIFVLSLILCSHIILRRSGVRRRVKFIAIFFTVQLLLGGAVSFSIPHLIRSLRMWA